MHAFLAFRSGYDFGYLLKILTCQPVPTSEAEFFELLNIYFPVIYDIKYMMKFCENLHGGLNKLAEMLEVCVRMCVCVCVRVRVCVCVAECRKFAECFVVLYTTRARRY
jgi:hypothetical protein